MKSRFFYIALIAILLFAGCDTVGNSRSSPETSIEPPKTTAAQTTAESVTEASRPAVSPTDVVAVIKNLPQYGMNEKINTIQYGQENRLIIWSDKLYLFDILTKKVTAQLEIDDTASSQNITPTNNGYAQMKITGAAEATDSLGLSKIKVGIIQFDAMWKPKSDFDMTPLLEDPKDGLFINSAVSTDGKYLAFSSFSGLYLYSFETQQKSQLIDFKAEDNSSRLGLSTIEQLGFTNQNTVLVFKGQSLDVPPIENKQSFDTVGRINIDGTGLVNQKFENYPAKELTIYPDKVLIAEDFMTANGQMAIMDSQTAKSQIFKLTDKKEGVNIYGSDKGACFASSVRADGGWTVRVYDTETCTLQAEQFISSGGEELYEIRDPVLRVLDDFGVCAVLLGHSQASVDTKIDAFTF